MDIFDDIPEFLEELAKSDIPKELQGKIPDGYALINMAEALTEMNETAERYAKLERAAAKAATRFGLGGFVIGAGLGAAGGYFFARKRLETKYNQISEDEIAEMREHYQAKTVALENTVAKPDLEEVVREQGYSTEPPMAVTPPSAVVEAASRDEGAEEKKQEKKEAPEPEVRNVFERDEPQEEDGWDYHTERSRRSPLRPYVIHKDEKDEREDVYDTMTWTYYEQDDVLCNEIDEVVAGEDRERLIGEANLDRFGHGSGDPNIVYIRNDKSETVIELCRSPNSYAEEVHGFTHSDTSYPRHRRPSFDDE